jgi:hypothetical protein
MQPRIAAETIAFEILKPVLRSRGNVPAAAIQYQAEHSAFRDEMETLFRGTASGRLILPRLWDLADKVGELEQRVRELERRVPPQNVEES